MKRFLKLMGKDWRLYRPAIVGMVLLMFVPYAVNSYMVHHMKGHAFTVKDSRTHRTLHQLGYYYAGPYPRAMQNAMSAVGMGAFLVLLMAPFFGACAFAIERRDRSAEFLAMLPVRRHTIISNKLLLAGFLLLLTASIEYLLGIAVFPWIWIYRGTPAAFHTEPIALYFSWALQFAVGAGMFGMAWMFSILLKSPAIAGVIAIAAAILAIGLGLLWSDNFANAVTPLVVAGFGIGTICLVVGNILYVKRVAP